jgi:hypothetical protein
VTHVSLFSPRVTEPIMTGPRAALCKLRFSCDAARADWLAQQRTRAMLIPCARSLNAVRSALRCWDAFCKQVMCGSVRRPLACPCWTQALGHQQLLLPPQERDLVAWSALFRNCGTFRNYLAHVRTACLIAEVSVEVAAHHNSVRTTPLVQRCSPPHLCVVRSWPS